MTKSADERWEDGIKHDKRSIYLAYCLRDIDDKYNHGCLDLKFGGDGDLGEELLYLLDIYFELKDNGDV